jgi:hypothetical protein
MKLPPHRVFERCQFIEPTAQIGKPERSVAPAFQVPINR